jgi:hypothetical protein
MTIQEVLTLEPEKHTRTAKLQLRIVKPAEGSRTELEPAKFKEETMLKRFIRFEARRLAQVYQLITCYLVTGLPRRSTPQHFSMNLTPFSGSDALNHLASLLLIPSATVRIRLAMCAADRVMVVVEFHWRVLRRGHLTC